MTATGAVQLPVVVVPDVGPPRDVVLDCAATTSVADLTRILVPDGTHSVPPLFHARRGIWLDARQRIASIGLRAGDALVLGAVPTAASTDVTVARVARSARRLVAAGPSHPVSVEIAVVGGSGTGRRVEVGPGDHVVGRDAAGALAVADILVSRAHLRIDVQDDGALAVAPVTRTGAVFVDGLRIEVATPLHGGEVVRIGSHALAIRELRATHASGDGVPDADTTGRVPFNRPPRPRAPSAPAPIAVPAPPETPNRHHLGWGASLAPMIVGGAAWLLTGSTMLLVFMALSPIIGVWTFVEDGRRGQRRFRTERRAYLARLDAASDRLRAARTAERRARRAAQPDLVVLAERARVAAPDLWDRRWDDPDFLELRVGTDACRAEARAVLADGGDPNLRAVAARRLDGDPTLADVPVTVPLALAGPLGISGPVPDVGTVARALLLQIAGRHSPRDVRIVAAIPDAHRDEWAWLEWLPHAGVEGVPGAAVVGGASGDDRVRALLRLVDARAREAREVTGTGAASGPSVVVVLDGAAVTDRPDCARLLAEGPAMRVFPIWLAPTAHEVPGECRTSVGLRRENGGLRASWPSGDGSESIDCTADVASRSFARQVATTLAAIHDVTARQVAGAIPRSVALPDALGLTAPTIGAVTGRWAESHEGLAAVIGSGADGPVAVDLRHDGPHALVAGTTGSGKSELLRTLIASLATAHSPERVNFLLVDYKGGAAFRECAELPHTVGLVTDLDHQLARRVLTSLDAEVKRRELLLHEARAKDLVELERRNPAGAPASLVIVVDEFAALVRDVPEFVDGVVDIAQRGRSLGLHLVLASQRPNGVVSENVRANANLRIALRVHEADDSRDVIGTAAAATIPRSLPGRAFVRTGPGEIVELQCAYAGAAVGGRPDAAGPVVRDFPLSAAGSTTDRAGRGPTDLTRLVDIIRAAASSIGTGSPAAPWLPPLPSCIPLDAVPPGGGATHDRARSVALGLLDEPERQRQIPFLVDFESCGSLAIVGAGGSGKTTALRTLAAALAATTTEDARIYAIDAAGHGLDPIAELPHCGGVVAAADPDRVTALLAFLHDQLELRAAVIADAGVGTLGELRRSPGPETFPRIFLFVDGYGSFAETYERIDLGEWLATLHAIARGGRAVGIHLAVTAERLHALPASLTATMPVRLLLRSADPDDVPGIRRGDASRLSTLPAGRAISPDGLELQIAVAGTAPDLEAQRAALDALGGTARGRGVAAAPAVPLLPSRVTLASLPATTAPLTAMFALTDRGFAGRAVDLRHDPFLIIGPRASGRSTALTTIASALSAGPRPCETISVRPRDGIAGAVATLDAVLSRFEGIAHGPDDVDAVRAGRAGTVVLLDDGELAVDGPIAAQLDRLLAIGATQPVRVVAAIDPTSAARAFGGWVGELRRARRALLLAPDLDVDGDLVGVRLKARPGQAFPPGRGFLVVAGRVELVQVALADALPSGGGSVVEAVGGTPPLPTASTADGGGATIAS
jgi:S-DNA-T family DNA segregation ATPase FtsK/SpoIIIE